MLICKNVIVNGRRTSMRLDKETWSAMNDICARENLNIHDLCSKIDEARGKSGLSCSVRLFILSYYRTILKKYEQESARLAPEFTTQSILNTLSL